MQNGAIRGLQIGARGIANRGSLRDFKSGQKDYKLGQRFQIGARDFKSGQRLQIGAREITNRGRGFKSGQGLQIGAEHKKQNNFYSKLYEKERKKYYHSLKLNKVIDKKRFGKL